ncbi:DUF3168 domain-containing protein [Shimia marina]|uniref:Gene transfer agent protein n=1 Tax=Shimia marina TaxID=321267 RepID=A0A0P1FDN4_9RHOB|nr:DUF3168 domain-containing protein [Shimia marina]CUH53458.1 hypothetical protein SHM7688_02912 [Shimia marina]SFD76449.1 Protein of unknown function [Shimia marina]
MSYGVGAALQTAIYQRLAADVTLAAVVGDAIYDAMPRGKLPSLYVALGAETVRDRSDGSGRGAEHRFVVSVIGTRDGFKQVKAAAVAVSDALIEADMSLSRGRLVALHFDRAQARRVTARNLRRIDLRFVARVEDNHS